MRLTMLWYLIGVAGSINAAPARAQSDTIRRFIIGRQETVRVTIITSAIANSATAGLAGNTPVTYAVRLINDGDLHLDRLKLAHGTYVLWLSLDSTGTSLTGDCVHVASPSASEAPAELSCVPLDSIATPGFTATPRVAFRTTRIGPDTLGIEWNSRDTKIDEYTEQTLPGSQTSLVFSVGRARWSVALAAN